MGFGFAGAGAGASNALEEILAQQMVRAQLEQRQKEQAAQLALQTRQVEGVESDRATNRALQTRAHDLAEQKYRDEQAQQATDRNVGTDASNVLSMPGMDNAAKAQELTSSVLRNPNASSAPGMLKTIEGLTKAPTRDPIKDHEEIAKIDAKYRAKPTGPQPDYEWVTRGNQPTQIRKGTAQPGDRPYEKPAANSNVTDPAQAAETRTRILAAAKALKDDGGLGNLVGNRIGNWDYNMGLSDSPRAGTSAANAAAKFNTLKSLLTLDNLKLLKGAMSDKDLLFLQAAGSSLDTKMDDPVFIAELDKIIEKFENATGAGGAHPSDQPPDAATAAAQALIEKARKGRKP